MKHISEFAELIIKIEEDIKKLGKYNWDQECFPQELKQFRDYGSRGDKWIQTVFMAIICGLMLAIMPVGIVTVIVSNFFSEAAGLMVFCGGLGISMLITGKAIYNSEKKERYTKYEKALPAIKKINAEFKKIKFINDFNVDNTNKLMNNMDKLLSFYNELNKIIDEMKGDNKDLSWYTNTDCIKLQQCWEMCENLQRVALSSLNQLRVHLIKSEGVQNINVVNQSQSLRQKVDKLCSLWESSANMSATTEINMKNEKQENSKLEMSTANDLISRLLDMHKDDIQQAIVPSAPPPYSEL